MNQAPQGLTTNEATNEAYVLDHERFRRKSTFAILHLLNHNDAHDPR